MRLSLDHCLTDIVNSFIIYNKYDNRDHNSLEKIKAGFFSYESYNIFHACLMACFSGYTDLYLVYGNNRGTINDYLMAASYGGQVSFIQKMFTLEQIESCFDGMSLYAAENNKPDVIDYLERNGCELDWNTIFSRACVSESYHLIDKAERMINITCDSKINGLLFASANGRINLVKKLVSKYEYTPNDLSKALNYALYGGEPQTISYFLNMGISCMETMLFHITSPPIYGKKLGWKYRDMDYLSLQ